MDSGMKLGWLAAAEKLDELAGREYRIIEDIEAVVGTETPKHGVLDARRHHFVMMALHHASSCLRAELMKIEMLESIGIGGSDV